MIGTVARHTARLRLICAAMLISTAIYGLIVFLTPPPEQLALAQGDHLLWILGFLAVVNVVTIMPVYRAMLAGPRRVYAVSQQVEPLLTAHSTAHVVAFIRLEAVAILGLVLFFLTGRGDWFWIFNGVAAVGMLLLWPLREKVTALIGPGDDTGPVPAV